ncbi:MAG: hypothetical protein IIC96_14610 [Chloroflexi bacterium]|nr:hypothetical protein [Chloroflexota bacterium]
MNRLYIVLLFGVALLAGCSVAGDPIPTLVPPTSAPVSIEVPREVISLSISLYLLVDDKEEPDPEISTHRTEEDLREILEGMNDIWSQADIRLELQIIESVEVPKDILQGMLARNLGPFFREIGDGIALPQTSAINGFYIRSIGGSNGINPFRSPTFFVIDEPTVFDRRVSSHELGHILGLHHVLNDPGRLLFSGTNGMTLTEDEATVARYFAQGIIQGTR